MCLFSTGGLFPTGAHEYEVFRFALAQHHDVPKLVPQVDMVDTASSFSMTYACKFSKLSSFFHTAKNGFFFPPDLEMLRLHLSNQGCDGSRKWWIY